MCVRAKIFEERAKEVKVIVPIFLPASSALPLTTLVLPKRLVKLARTVWRRAVGPVTRPSTSRTSTLFLSSNEARYI